MKILLLNISIKELEFIKDVLPDLADLAASAKEIVKEQRIKREDPKL